jgi:hypothetical protein
MVHSIPYYSTSNKKSERFERFYFVFFSKGGYS